MSSSPQTVVGARMYGAGVASNVGYTNGSDGATPPCHEGIFSGDLLQLSFLFAKFSPYSARHATDGTAGMAWGPLS